MMPTRLVIGAQVEQMFAVLAKRGTDVLERLQTAAYEDLTGWPDFDVVARPAPGTAPADESTSCDVAGAYIIISGRPTLVIAEASQSRMNFTALHELGHHLQRTDDDLFTNLFDSPASAELEEAACDHFAAQVLLPAHLVQEHLRVGVTAESITALWQASSASRMAVCIAASRRLPAPGHVLLLDLEGSTVIDANRELPRIARGSDQSRHPVITRGLARPSHRAEGTGRLQYRDGIRGAELFTQTGDIGDYVVAVAVQDSAPWRSLSVPSRDAGPQARWRDCEHCEATFPSFDRPCLRCNVVVCPECSRCNCTRPEQRCDSCFLVQPLAAFGESSTRCLDCS